MADNTQVNVPTSSGDIIRTEDVGGGVKTQVVKLDIGGPGVDGPQVDAANPMPISAAALPLPSGAATLAEQQTQTAGLAAIFGDTTTIAGDTTSIDGKTPALGQAAMAASVPVAIASNQSAVPVSISGNQAVNLAQVNGATVNVQAGNVGTGTQRVTVATDDVNLAAINAVNGVTSGAKVITDANGTLQQYLRGLVYLLITAGAQAARGIPWNAAAASQGTVLTTELNSLADGAFSGLGTEFNNATGLWTYGMLEINLASLNPATNPFIQCFMVPSLDGTNYPDAPSSTNPGLQYLCTPILNVATGSATKRISTPPFLLPPAKLKFSLFQDVNVSFGASGNTVTLYTFKKGLS